MGPYRDRLRVAAAVLLVVAAVLLVAGTSLERSQAASETGQAGIVRRPQSKAGEHTEAAEQTTTSRNQTIEPTKGSGTKKATKPTQSSHNENTEQAEGKHDEAAEQTATTHNEATEQAQSSHSQTTEPANSRGNKEATEQGGGRHSEAAELAGSSHNQAAEHAESGEEVLGINLEGIGLTVTAAVASLLLAGLLLIVAGRQLLWAVVLFALAFVALDLRESVHQASEARAGLLAIALLTAMAHLGVAGLAGARLRAPRHTAATP